MALTTFIQRALGDKANVWLPSKLETLATCRLPDTIFGRRQNLLQGDIYEQWARWFAEGLADPQRIAADNTTYTFLYEEVFKRVETRFRSEKTRPEIKEIASVAANVIQSLSYSCGPRRRRKALTSSEKRLLIELSGSTPRCWICGVAFKEEAIENFLNPSSKNRIATSLFVDILKPRGLIERDFAIEADHVLPFSKGGHEEDNLGLACGWCNRAKSAHVSIYDVEGQPRTAGDNHLQLHTLPQPFWVVRLLALVRYCEHPGGCTKHLRDAELTVTPIHEGGSINPTNLRVVCYDHDPLSSKRLQPPSIVKKLWNIQ